MIFLAVAGPTAGRATSAASVAEFSSTGPAGAAVAAFLRAAGALCADAGAGLAGALTVTSGVTFAIVAAETPALDRSLTAA